MAEADEVEELSHAASAIGCGNAGNLEPVGDVASHVEMGEQTMVLEHQAETPSMGRYRGQISPAEHHPASGQRLQAGHGPQQGRLARPARPDHRHHLARADVETETVEHQGVLVPDRDLLDAKTQGRSVCGAGPHRTDTPGSRRHSMTAATAATTTPTTTLRASA